jgi:hypothetical protein
VTDVWRDVFLGAIALATVVMAILQIGAIVFATRLARRVDRLTETVEQEIKPVLANLSAISQDAARAAALAAAQVERADRLFADVSQRVDETVTTVQRFIIAPARETRAFLSGLRAAFQAFRELRRRRRPEMGLDEEDALFIG